MFTLSGRMEAAQLPELKELFDRDYRNTILDLRDVRLANRDAVRFLRSCEADGMKLENCRPTSASGSAEKTIERTDEAALL